MTRLTSTILISMMLILSLTPFPIGADGNVRGETERGATTREWLKLQASGAQSSPTPPRQPGDAASRTYQRYLKSFERPIAESYFSDQPGFVGK